MPAPQATTGKILSLARSAALRLAGTDAYDLVQLDANGALPALDGSNLTGIAAGGGVFDINVASSGGDYTSVDSAYDDTQGNKKIRISTNVTESTQLVMNASTPHHLDIYIEAGVTWTWADGGIEFSAIAHSVRIHGPGTLNPGPNTSNGSDLAGGTGASGCQMIIECAVVDCSSLTGANANLFGANMVSDRSRFSPRVCILPNLSFANYGLLASDQLEVSGVFFVGGGTSCQNIIGYPSSAVSSSNGLSMRVSNCEFNGAFANGGYLIRGMGRMQISNMTYQLDSPAYIRGVGVFTGGVDPNNRVWFLQDNSTAAVKGKLNVSNYQGVYAFTLQDDTNAAEISNCSAQEVAPASTATKKLISNCHFTGACTIAGTLITLNNNTFDSSLTISASATGSITGGSVAGAFTNSSTSWLPLRDIKGVQGVNPHAWYANATLSALGTPTYHFKCDGAAGSTITDEIGATITLNKYGGTAGDTGRYGPDGSPNRAVLIPDGAEKRESSTAIGCATGDFSVSAWFRFANYASDYDVWSWSDSATAPGDLLAGIQVKNPFSTRNYAAYHQTTATDTVVSPSIDAPVLNRWHHSLYVRSGTTLYLYLDGFLVGSGTVSDFSFAAAEMYLGGVRYSGFDTGAGQLEICDYIQYDGTALSAAVSHEIWSCRAVRD